MILDTDGYDQITKNDSLYIYEKILIYPQDTKTIILPYIITENKKFRYFQLSKRLSLQGLVLLWSNINDESSKKSLEFIIKNGNMDRNISEIESIIGSKFKIELKPNSEFGQIYLI